MFGIEGIGTQYDTDGTMWYTNEHHTKMLKDSDYSWILSTLDRTRSEINPMVAYAAYKIYSCNSLCSWRTHPTDTYLHGEIARCKQEMIRAIQNLSQEQIEGLWNESLEVDQYIHQQDIVNVEDILGDLFTP